jgi:hypothetical protein
MTNKMQLRSIICFLSALHVSNDIFAHHQEHLNCIYSFWVYSRVSLSAAAADNTHNRQTSMTWAEFKPAIAESELLQAHALDRAATGSASPHLYKRDIYYIVIYNIIPT